MSDLEKWFENWLIEVGLDVDKENRLFYRAAFYAGVEAAKRSDERTV